MPPAEGNDILSPEGGKEVKNGIQRRAAHSLVSLGAGIHNGQLSQALETMLVKMGIAIELLSFLLLLIYVFSVTLKQWGETGKFNLANNIIYYLLSGGKGLPGFLWWCLCAGMAIILFGIVVDVVVSFG